MDPKHEDKEVVHELEGWLFGKKVIYLDTEKPFYEQIPEHFKYMFGERPLPPGFKRKMQDWEILMLGFLIAIGVMFVIVWWGKPETSLTIWGEEELRERRILARREQNIQVD